jgi:DNA-binding response OmpR family regulator
LEAELDVACVESSASNMELVGRALQAMGHHCEGFSSGQDLVVAVRNRIFDLFLVAGQLPDMDSAQLVMWLRNTVGARIPVMVMVPQGNEELMVRLLSVGADGCASSPVRGPELSARVHALLRRAYRREQSGGQAVFGPYVFDLVRARVTCAHQVVEASRRELELAHYLFVNAGRLIPREALQMRIWGEVSGHDSRALDKLISRIRVAFHLGGEHGYRLVAMYGHGFKLMPIPGLGCAQESAQDPARVQDAPAYRP